MSGSLTNTTCTKPIELPLEFIKSMIEPVYFWITVVATVLPIIAIILTKSRCVSHPVEQYIDDETVKYVQVFNLYLKYAGNPLFPRISLFNCPPHGSYEVTGFEFGSYDTILPLGLFNEDAKKGQRHVSISEKSVLKERRISTLKVTIESKPPDYRTNIKTEIHPDRIVITNDNHHAVRRFAVRVASLSNVDGLRSNPRIYDVYREDGRWVIRINEIPGKVLQKSGRETIWL